MKKQTNTSVTAIFKNGERKIFETIEEASSELNLGINSIKSRANKPGSGAKSKDGIMFEWADPAVRRSQTAKRSRNKGKKYELDIIHELIDIGYKGLKSSRSESRTLDNAKIDIAETEDRLPCYIQCKATANTPNVEKISADCPIKDRPLVVFWKKQKANEKQPEYVIMPKSFFYDLIKKI